MITGFLCKESTLESEEVPLAFESFVHGNGVLYSCVSQHGHRMYVDESRVREERLKCYDVLLTAAEIQLI